MARRPAMRDVELVEPDDAPEPPPGAAGASPRPGAAGPPAHGGPRRAARAAAVVALVALAATGTSLGAERREAARVAALADVAGVVATPLDAPVGVAWSLRDVVPASLRSAGDRVVGVGAARDGGLDAVALDPGTGAQLWRTRIAPPGRGTDPAASCHVPQAAAGRPAQHPVAVCVVVDDTDTAEAVGVGSVTHPTRTRLVVLDTTTGSVRSDTPVPAMTTAAVVGPDVLLAHVGDDGHARLRRVDPRDGTRRWVFRAPEPALVEDLGPRRLALRTDDHVAVLDTGPAWALEVRTGEVLRRWPVPACETAARRGTVPLADRDAVFRPAGGGTGEVVDLPSGRTFAVAGAPVPLRPDDGSVPGLVVVVHPDRSGSTAYDTASGRVLWTSSDLAGGPALLLDGRLVSLDDGVLRAVDARTGAPLWTVDPGPGATGSVATDGRVVLLTAGHGSGRSTLSAWDLRDGRSRWSTALGTDLYLITVDGGLYGVAQEGPVALARPDHPG